MICNIDDIKDNGASVYKLNNSNIDYEIIIVRKNFKIHGFKNLCPHANLPLNLNSLEVLSRDKKHLICKNHAALFDIDSGVCVSGPCIGKGLELVNLKIKDEKIFFNESKGI